MQEKDSEKTATWLDLPLELGRLLARRVQLCDRKSLPYVKVGLIASCQTLKKRNTGNEEHDFMKNVEICM